MRPAGANQSKDDSDACKVQDTNLLLRERKIDRFNPREEARWKEPLNSKRRKEYQEFVNRNNESRFSFPK